MQDYLVYLSVVCALMCVLGLTLGARCTCLGRSPPPPLNKKVIEALPKQTLSPEDDPIIKFTDCAICLAEFAVGEQVRVLEECGHCYHVTCIDTWLRKHSSCPSCRHILAGARHTCNCCKCHWSRVLR